MTGLLADNWPWRLAGTPTRIALMATAGNLALGIGLYFALQAVVRVTIGSADIAQLGAAVPIYSAQVGVCWVFWMIMWANCFENKPSSASAVRNVVSWVLVTLALGVVTFVAYYFLIAGAVLHEPAVADRMNGNALGWVDWWVMWTLIYVLCFDSFGLSRLRAPTTAVNK